MASERKFVSENIRRVLLKEFFQKEVEMAGFGGIDIQRTPMGTRVTLTVERPGMVIGRKGAKIKDLTRKVSEVYGFDNPQIEVQECRDPSTNPQIMAQKLALALERGWHFRRAGHSTLRRIKSSAVKGCQVRLSGKLTGQRHRTEKFKWGHIKFCGEPSLTAMDRGYAIAKKKLGLIGVTVDIMKPDAVLPDEITIKDLPTIEEVAEVSGDAPVEQTGDVEEGGNAEEKASDVAEDAPEASDKPEEAAKEKEISKRKQKRMERQKAKEVTKEEGSSEVKPEPVPKEEEKPAEVKPEPVPKEEEKPADAKPEPVPKKDEEPSDVKPEPVPKEEEKPAEVKPEAVPKEEEKPAEVKPEEKAGSPEDKEGDEAKPPVKGEK